FVVASVAPAADFAGLRFAHVRLVPSGEGASDVEGLALMDTLADARGTLCSEQEQALFVAALMRNRTFRETRKASDDPYVGALRLRYGYTLTVHASQGNEWPCVYLDPYVPPLVEREQALRWRYTAITRAASRCFLIGTPNL